MEHSALSKQTNDSALLKTESIPVGNLYSKQMYLRLMGEAKKTKWKPSIALLHGDVALRLGQCQCPALCWSAHEPQGVTLRVSDSIDLD